MSFNQEVVIGNSVTKIMASFLSSCPNFNQFLIIPYSVTDIDGGFLYGCTSYENNIYCPNNVSAPSGWSDSVFIGCINPNSTDK
jgi:hypothetical protein